MSDLHSEQWVVGIFADMTVSSHSCDECGMSFSEFSHFTATEEGPSQHQVMMKKSSIEPPVVVIS